MKKVIIVLLVLAALLLLLLPGAVGMVAEREYRALMVQSQELTPGLRYVVEDYQRGWFRSNARYRLEVDPALLLPAEELEELPPSFALQSQAEIHHGPLFLTALGAPGGSPGPGLALSLDALSVRGPEGAVTALPGQITTRLGLFGRNRSDIVLEPVEANFGASADGGTFKWAGMQGHVHFSSGLDDLQSDLEIGGMELGSPEWRMQLGAMQFAGHHKLTEFGFWAGAGSAEMGTLQITTPTFGPLVIGPVQAQADVRLSDQPDFEAPAVEIDFIESFDAVTVGDWEGGPLVFSINIDDLDAAALGELSNAFNPATGQPMMEAADPGRLLEQMQALLVRGPHVRLREFSFGTPDGDLLMTAEFAFPPTGPGELGALLIGLDATARVRIPTAVTARLRTINPALGPQLDGLLAGGLLQEDGDYLVMDAALKSGLLTINGQPLPIPLGF